MELKNENGPFCPLKVWARRMVAQRSIHNKILYIRATWIMQDDFLLVRPLDYHPSLHLKVWIPGALSFTGLQDAGKELCISWEMG